MDDVVLTCPACGSDELTFTNVVAAHREGAPVGAGTGDAPPPHDVLRTAYFVCERCDSPGELFVPEDWEPPTRA